MGSRRMTSFSGNDLTQRQNDQKFSEAQVQRIKERRKLMASEDFYSLPNSPRDSRATVAGKMKTAEKSLSRMQSNRLAPASDDSTTDNQNARRTILQKQRNKVSRKETIRESLSQNSSPMQSPRSTQAKRSTSKLGNVSPSSPIPRSKLFVSPTDNRRLLGTESSPNSPNAASSMKRRETMHKKDGGSPVRKNSLHKAMSGVRIFSEEEKPALKVRLTLDRRETVKPNKAPSDVPQDLGTPSGRRRSERRNSVDIGETILHGSRMKSNSPLFRSSERRNSLDESMQPSALSPRASKGSIALSKDGFGDSPLGMTKNLETFLLDDFDHRVFAVNISRESKAYLASICESLQDMRKVSTEEMQSVFKAHYAVFLRVINDVQGLHGKVSEIGRQLEQLQQIVRFRTKSIDGMSAGYGSVNNEESEINGNDDDSITRERSSSVSISYWLNELDKDEEPPLNTEEVKDKKQDNVLTKSYSNFDDTSMIKLEDLLEQFELTVSEQKLLESAVLAKEIQRYIAATSSTSQNQAQRHDVINEFLHAYAMFKTSLVTATHDSASDPATLKHLILSIVELEGEHVAQKVLLESFSLWNSHILHATGRSRSSSWDERIQTVILLTNSIVSIIARGLEQADKLLGNENNSLYSYAYLWAQNELAKGVSALKRLGPSSGIANLATFVSIIIKNIKWLEDRAHISLMGVLSKTLTSILRPAIIQTIRSSGVAYTKQNDGSPKKSTSPLHSLSHAHGMSPSSSTPEISVDDYTINLKSVRSNYTRQIIERVLHLICLLDNTINEVSLLWQVPLIFCEILEQRARGNVGIVELEYGAHQPLDVPPSDTAKSSMSLKNNLSEDEDNAEELLPSNDDSHTIQSVTERDEEESKIKKEESHTVMLRTCNSDNLGLDILTDVFQLTTIILNFCKHRLQIVNDDYESDSIEEEAACSSTVYRNAEFRNLGRRLRQGFARLWAGTLCEKNTASINVNVYLVDVVDEPLDTQRMSFLNEQSLWTNEVIHVAMHIKSLVDGHPSNREELSMIHIRFAVECLRFIAHHEFWNDMTQLSKEKGALTFHDLGFMYLVHDVCIMKIILSRLLEMAIRCNSSPASCQLSEYTTNLNSTGHTTYRKTHSNKDSIYDDHEILSVLNYTTRNIIDKANSIYVKINETAPDAEIVERGREAAVQYVKRNYNAFLEGETAYESSKYINF